MELIFLWAVCSFAFCSFLAYLFGDFCGWTRGWDKSSEFDKPYIAGLTTERDEWRTRAMTAETHLSAANELLDKRQKQFNAIKAIMEPDEV